MPQTTTRRAAAPRRTRGAVPTRGAIVAVLAAAGLALGGCSTRVPPLEEVWPEVSASIRDAGSVAIDGTIRRDGEEMTVDIAGQVDDSSYSGSLSVGEARVRVVGDAEHTYLKPNAAFYEALGGGAEVGEAVGDRWLRVPADEGGFTMSTFYSGFSEDLPDAAEFGESDYTSEVVRHDGEDVYRYTGMDARDGDPVTLYVSRDHRLLRVEVEGTDPSAPSSGSASPSSGSASPSAGAVDPDAADLDGGSGTVEFSDWDAVEPVEMPAQDEVFTVPGA
ncbi:hypothetical protein E7744_05890 [Citricoccus sp. SGAir0253]|uniref:hypothetical protein n=1 Tax=Citricoccus sp. SGAir0253 TaxID=2567881 RepID=UPI0010CCDD52|nr:hypothetical protein [Citricoccus sp. SGAir0253]QCU77780.1 hypothetical protein E7744_05890 [Citricoccus sp. SGAir0253]